LDIKLANPRPNRRDFAADDVLADAGDVVLALEMASGMSDLRFRQHRRWPAGMNKIPPARPGGQGVFHVEHRLMRL
jgi:hypothetical protein